MSDNVLSDSEEHITYLCLDHRRLLHFIHPRPELAVILNGTRSLLNNGAATSSDFAYGEIGRGEVSLSHNLSQFQDNIIYICSEKFDKVEPLLTQCPCPSVDTPGYGLWDVMGYERSILV